MALERLATNMLRLVHTMARGPAGDWLSLATVNGYDATMHRVQCTLQPSGRQTEALRIVGMWPGMAHALRPGYQGTVGLIAGTPFCFFGTLHSDADVPPAAALSIDGDVFASGVVTAAGGMVLSPGEVLPMVSAAYRGQMLLIGPTAGGVADKLYVCLRAAGGSYSWVLVASG